MDHYCLFAMKPIGLRNHRYFMLFVWFIWLSALYAMLMSVLPLWGVCLDLVQVMGCEWVESAVPGGGTTRDLTCTAQ